MSSEHDHWGRRRSCAGQCLAMWSLLGGNRRPRGAVKIKETVAGTCSLIFIEGFEECQLMSVDVRGSFDFDTPMDWSVSVMQNVLAHLSSH